MKKIKEKYVHLNSVSRLSHLSSPIIALTGGIATGKSTVSEYLKKSNHPLICADQMIKRIYEQDETIEFIAQNYPNCIEKNKINFKTLREIFFKNEQTQKKIEAHLYPRLSLEVQKEFIHIGKPDYIFYDVPLLFEKGMASGVDLILLVYSPYTTQKERLLARDKISNELAEQILEKQWSIEKKRPLSHFIINNDGPIEALPEKINIILDEILY